MRADMPTFSGRIRILGAGCFPVSRPFGRMRPEIFLFHGASNLHEFVQFWRGHALVEETEFAFIFHLVYGSEKAGHCGSVE